MIVEKQLLPNPALKETYERVVWLYVYRDFGGGDEDRHAERISMRFGVTSWPQLFLAEPETLEILQHTGRSVESFLRAVEGTRVKGRYPLTSLERGREAERLADRLERRPSAKEARKHLDAEDMVLRLAALRVLAGKDPQAIVAAADDLLTVPNDPFRYEVCAVLKKAKTGARALEKVVEDPGRSLNPNVLRIRAVQALAECGDAQSVPAIAKWATTGVYFNGLTGIAVDALAAIAAREKKARPAVEAALKRAYPEPADPGDARATRACIALAKRVHKALSSKRPFPKVYDEKAREKLMR